MFKLIKNMTSEEKKYTKMFEEHKKICGIKLKEIADLATEQSKSHKLEVMKNYNKYIESTEKINELSKLYDEVASILKTEDLIGGVKNMQTKIDDLEHMILKLDTKADVLKMTNKLVIVEQENREYEDQIREYKKELKHSTSNKIISKLQDEIHELKKVINDLEITNKKLNEEIRLENIETYKNDKFINKILDTEKIVSANIDSTEIPIENTIVSDRTEKKTNKSTKKIW